MPRQIPVALKDALSKSATTTAILIKITPVIPGGVVYGATSHDQTIVYNDGDGEVTYHAPIGMISPAMIGMSDLTTDQAQSKHLFPEYDIPELSEQAIRAGVYDFAEYSVYLVDYQNLSAGHATLKAGTTGRKEITDGGLSFINELRDLSSTLKQSICGKDSLSCRAIFGSQKVGSSTPGPQVNRDWCGFDAESILVSAEVASVGAETTLTFRANSYTGWSTNHLVPGIVKFSTGDNAGLTFEIASNTADGWITLAIETGYQISVGDEFDYRPDCSKIARDINKGCKHWFEGEWINHFRGEPDIPMGDEGQMMTPGAGVGPGQGGNTFEPLVAE